MGKRLALKKYRVGLDLTQTEIAEMIGVDRTTYAAIENGYRDGARCFWLKLHAAFPEVDEATMWRFYSNAPGI